MVRHWLKIRNTTVTKGNVDKYGRTVTNFSVAGFECDKSEPSGTRFWSLIKEICNTPEEFFNNCFAYNYCPFLFLDKNGNNLSVADFMVNYQIIRTILLYCFNIYLLRKEGTSAKKDSFFSLN